MNKLAHWHQPTPLMQLRVIVMALEGWASNLEEGIVTELRYANKVTALTKELTILLPFVEQGKW